MIRFKIIFIAVFVAASGIIPTFTYAVPSSIATFLDEETHVITEDGCLPWKLPESTDFVDYVTANWKVVLHELPTIAPDARRQSLLVVAAEFLPPKDYVAFVDGLCGLRSQDQLSPEGLLFVLWAKMRKSGFLAFNYDQPEVATVVSKLESLVIRNDRSWQDFFTELKSGKMKEHVVERMKREGGSLPESYAGSASDHQLTDERGKPEFSSTKNSGEVQTSASTASRRMIFAIFGGLIIFFVFLGFAIKRRSMK